MSVDQRRHMLTISLGYGDNEAFLVKGPDLTIMQRIQRFPGWDRQLAKRAQKLGVPVRTDVTVAEVVAEFQRTGKLLKPNDTNQPQTKTPSPPAAPYLPAPPVAPPQKELVPIPPGRAYLPPVAQAYKELVPTLIAALKDSDGEVYKP